MPPKTSDAVRETTFCIHDIEYMKSTGGINRITLKDCQNNFPELKIGTDLTFGELQNYLKNTAIKKVVITI